MELSTAASVDASAESNAIADLVSGNSSDYAPYDGDTSDFDYVRYMPGDSLQLIQTTWPQDPAFLPTSITYSLAFIVGEWFYGFRSSVWLFWTLICFCSERRGNALGSRLCFPLLSIFFTFLFDFESTHHLTYLVLFFALHIRNPWNVVLEKSKTMGWLFIHWRV